MVIILNSNFGIIVITIGLLGFDLVLWYQNWEYVKRVEYYEWRRKLWNCGKNKLNLY